MAKRNGKPKKKPRTKTGKDLEKANKVRRSVVEQRAESVRKLLCLGHRPHEIALAVMAQYEVEERTAYNYIKEARAGLRQLVDGDTGEMLSQCIGILMAVISDQRSTGAERVSASERGYGPGSRAALDGQRPGVLGGG